MAVAGAEGAGGDEKREAGGFGAEGFGDLPAVEGREADVGEEEGDFVAVGAEEADGFGTVARPEDAPAFGGEEFEPEGADVLFVFDEEDGAAVAADDAGFSV